MEKAVRNLVGKISKKYPFTLVDIGSMGGIQKKWRILKPYIRIIGFEPDEREFKELSHAKNEIYFNYALYSESKTLPYYITRSHGHSAILEPNNILLKQFKMTSDPDITVEKIEKIPMNKVSTLKNILQENSITDVDFIKLDTEGSELYILQGIGDYINEIFAMQIEVSFIKQHLKQPLFRDIDKFMFENGYELIDIRRNYWKRIIRLNFGRYKGKGQIIFADALYFKNIETFFKELEKTSDDNDKILSKIYKSILICVIYRLFDYAGSIINVAFEKKIIKQDDSVLTELKRLIKNSRFINFPGRFFLYRIFNKITNLLRKETDMIDCDLMIGNILDN